MVSEDGVAYNNEIMIEAKDITQMVKHVIRRSQGVPDSSIMHPMREWSLGLGSVALLVIVGVTIDILTYRYYNESIATAAPVVQTVVPYRAAQVESALTIYRAQHHTYELIRGVSSSNHSVVTPPASSTPVVVTTTSSTTVPVLPQEPVATSTATIPKEIEKPVAPPTDGETGPPTLIN